MNARSYRWTLPFALACICSMLTRTHSIEPIDVDPVVLAAQQARIDAMKSASRATIAIFGLKGDGGGSGVIITTDGYALTNYHVTDACGDHMRVGLDDGSVVDAVIVGIDPTGDVSLIRLLGRNDFPTAPMGDSSHVRIGQWCFAGGNPFGFATNLQPSISLGIVSGIHRYQEPMGTLLEYADCIQTDAAINPGNSGGPLFDLSAQIIGINGRCSFEKRGRVNVGVGYSISINQIKYFLGMLRSGRLVDHATMGATVSTSENGLAEVSNLLSASDAYRRGLRVGDVVLRLADRPVDTTNSFKNILGTLPKDWRVPIVVRRGGQEQTLLVRLDGVHTERQLVAAVKNGLDATPEQDDTPEKREATPAESEDDDESKTRSESEPPSELESKLLDSKPDFSLVQSMIEKREGFANYYFNRENKSRIWNGIQEQEFHRAATDAWVLRGNVAGEQTPIVMQITAQKSSLSIGSRSFAINFGDAFSDVISSRRESGMLLGMLALKSFLESGPDRIGDSRYLGTMPVYLNPSNLTLDAQPLYDAIESLWYDARTRFYTNTNSFEPTLIEAFGNASDDPAEVYLSNYRSFAYRGGEQKFPSRIRLQFGQTTLLVVDIESLEPSTAQETVPAPAVDAKADSPANNSNVPTVEPANDAS